MPMTKRHIVATPQSLRSYLRVVRTNGAQAWCSAASLPPTVRLDVHRFGERNRIQVHTVSVAARRDDLVRPSKRSALHRRKCARVEALATLGR